MEENTLFEGEEFITTSGDKVITLTNLRIRYNKSTFGKAHIISILLANISSIEIKYKSWLLILLIGVILIIAALIAGSQNQGEALMAGLVAGAICLLLYFITRRHVITISSKGGAKINIQTKGMKRERVLIFLNQIEKAIIAKK